MRRNNIYFLFLILITLLPRVILAFNLFGTPDTLNGEASINKFLNGFSFYGTDKFTYPPLWLYMLLGIDYLSKAMHIHFHILIHLPAIIFDVFLALLIYKVFLRKNNEIKSFTKTLFFVLNPISILVSGYHGQIDNIWIFWSILAYFFITQTSSKYKNIYAAMSLSIGICLKVFPIIFVPLFLKDIKLIKDKILFTVLSLCLLILSLIPILVYDRDNFLKSFVNYTIEHNYWGFSFFLAFFHYHIKEMPFIYNLLTSPQWERIPLYTFLIILYWYIYNKNIHLLSSMSLLVLGMLLFVPFFSVQWLVWPIAFLIINNNINRKLYFYSILGTIVLLVRYYLFLQNIPLELRPVDSGIFITTLNLYGFSKIFAFGTWIFLWILFIEELKPVKYNKGSLQ